MDSFEKTKEQLKNSGLKIIPEEELITSEEPTTDNPNKYKAVIKLGELTINTFVQKIMYSDIADVDATIGEIRFNLAFGLSLRDVFVYWIDDLWLELKAKVLENNIHVLNDEEFVVDTSNVLGKSNNAVYKGTLKKTDGTEIAVAIKKIDKKIVFQDLNGLIKEIIIHLKFPNFDKIPGFYGINYQKDFIYMIIDIIPNAVTLNKIVDAPLKTKVDYFIQTVSIVSELHSRKMIHRDLKPANVMVTDQGVVHLIDFGTCKACSKTASTTADARGTTYYMSPESMEHDEVDENSDTVEKKPFMARKSMDIWSLGCIFSEILSGKLPWTSMDFKTIVIHDKSMEKIIKKYEKKKGGITEMMVSTMLSAKTEFQIPPEITGEMREIIKKCTEVDFEKRITIDELKQELIKFHSTL